MGLTPRHRRNGVARSPTTTRPKREAAAAISPAAALRRRAGNEGAQRLVERHGSAKAKASTAHHTAAPSPQSTHDDGQTDSHASLNALKHRVRIIGRRQADHPKGKELAEATRPTAIAVEPEGRNRAAFATVDNLPSQEPQGPHFDRAKFKEAVSERLKRAIPDAKTGEDAARTLSHENGVAAAEGMRDTLDAKQKEAVGDLPAAAKSAEDPAKHQPDPPPLLLPWLPGARPATPGAAAGVPPRLPDAALDVSHDRADADAQMASENLTQPQLEQSNEPSFVDAANTRTAVEEQSRQGAEDVRAAEAATRGKAHGQVGAILANGINALQLGRVLGFTAGFAQQAASKSKQEPERERIAGELDRIQRETRSDVELMLGMMETSAALLFEVGLGQAIAAFDTGLAAMERTIREEDEGDSYNPLTIAIARWRDLDEAEVAETIKWARHAYNRRVDKAIDDVADFVGPQMDKIYQRIALGKQRAHSFVEGLDKSVRGIGQTELERIDDGFTAMVGEVDMRRDAMIDKLGESYAAASQKVEERAQAFRDANKSWWQKLKEKVAGVIRAIRQIKDLLFSVLARAAGIIGDIISAPGRFLSNLIDGVTLGFTNFRDRIADHLKEALFEWLFGQLGQAGITLPKRFDAAGIFGLIAGVLGITYANVRARAVTIVGEGVVSKLEAAAEIFRVLVTEGPAGLWRMLVDKLESLKDKAIEMLRDLLITKVIKAGIVWVLSLFNPVAGFIKACKAIYEIVMFIVDRAAAIIEFVNTVLDSLAAVVAGNIGGVAAKVEQALTRGLSLVIGLLASVLGLGGLGSAIREVIERIREPVNRAIDWLIKKAVGAVKFGVETGRNVVAKVFDWARAKAGFKDEDGKGHTIYVDTTSGTPALMIASSPMGAADFLKAYVHRKNEENPGWKTRGQTPAKIEAAQDAIEAAKAQLKIVEKHREAESTPQLNAALEKLLEKNVAVSAALGALINSDRSVADNEEQKYLLEGMTGTYESIPKPPGDKLTADHQPQASILQAAAKFKFFKKSGEMVERASSRAVKGYAINLYHSRHVEGRTYGGKGTKTKEVFVATVRDKVKGLATPKEQRAAAVRIIRANLKADARVIVTEICGAGDAHFADIKDLISDPRKQKQMIGDIKKRIRAGEEQVEHQDLASLIEGDDD